MGIFLKIENKQPLVPVPYPKAKKVSRLRWLLIVILLCLPISFLVFKLLSEYLFVQFSGIVIYDTLSIRAPQDGYIQSMSVHLGEPIRVGELMLQINSPQLNNKLTYLNNEKKRITNLVNDLKKVNQ